MPNVIHLFWVTDFSVCDALHYYISVCEVDSLFQCIHTLFITLLLFWNMDLIQSECWFTHIKIIVLLSYLLMFEEFNTLVTCYISFSGIFSTCRSFRCL